MDEVVDVHLATSTNLDVTLEEDLEADLGELSIEEEIEATGDIDIGQLERDLEVEESENEWDEEPEEEVKSPIQKILSKLKDAITNHDSKRKDKKIATVAGKIPALKGLLGKIGKKNSSRDELDVLESPDAFDDEDEDDVPKKKLKVIHIVIILVAVIGLFWEDLFPPDPKAPIAKFKKRKITKVKVKRPSKPVVKRTIVKKPVEPVDTSDKVEIKSDTDIPVTTDVKDKNKTADIKRIAETKKDDDLDDLFDDVDSKEKLDVPQKNSETEKADVSDKMNDVEDLKKNGDDDTIAVSGTGQSESGLQLTDGKIDDQVIDGSVNQDITKSILEDLEVKIKANKKLDKLSVDVRPTDPPSFEISGRGLVYNCSGKHWACIDSVSFKTCEQNYAWNSSQSRKVECYPVKIFSNVEGCEMKQQKNIDNIESTEFCKF